VSLVYNLLFAIHQIVCCPYPFRCALQRFKNRQNDPLCSKPYIEEALWQAVFLRGEVAKHRYIPNHKPSWAPMGPVGPKPAGRLPAGRRTAAGGRRPAAGGELANWRMYSPRNTAWWVSVIGLVASVFQPRLDVISRPCDFAFTAEDHVENVGSYANLMCLNSLLFLEILHVSLPYTHSADKESIQLWWGHLLFSYYGTVIRRQQ